MLFSKFSFLSQIAVSWVKKASKNANKIKIILITKHGEKLRVEHLSTLLTDRSNPNQIRSKICSDANLVDNEVAWLAAEHKSV